MERQDIPRQGSSSEARSWALCFINAEGHPEGHPEGYPEGHADRRPFSRTASLRGGSERRDRNSPLR